jgi:mono/diheme cytochrome c family protein
MKNKIILFILIGFVFLLAGCGTVGPQNTAAEPVAEESITNGEPDNKSTSTGMMGRGQGGGMMARHHATIPDEYSGLTNPTPADEASIERGGEIFVTHCASCHGDGGMGDGPAAVGLDPAPAAIAHTSQMLGDDYQFWRISEGGAMEPFNSGMIAWKDIIDEDARWDVINYVQALGSGQVMPRQGLGGATFDPADEAKRQAEMLAEAVLRRVITEDEAAIFAEAHNMVDEKMIQNREAGMGGSMDDMMVDVLADLVETGELTQTQANTFASVHDRLGEAGLMR